MVHATAIPSARPSVRPSHPSAVLETAERIALIFGKLGVPRNKGAFSSNFMSGLC